MKLPRLVEDLTLEDVRALADDERLVEQDVHAGRHDDLVRERARELGMRDWCQIRDKALQRAIQNVETVNGEARAALRVLAILRSGLHVDSAPDDGAELEGRA